jgi:hypothetical protein
MPAITEMGQQTKYITLNKGIWENAAILCFKANQKSSSKIDTDDETKIEVDSIDNILQGKKASFIKMDIKGAKLSALRGAEHTIQVFQLTLTICVYHKPGDIFNIPLFIHLLGQRYKYYIRHTRKQSRMRWFSIQSAVEDSHQAK